MPYYNIKDIERGGEMDFSLIKKAAGEYEAAMTKFLRDLIAIPGERRG